MEIEHSQQIISKDQMQKAEASPASQTKAGNEIMLYSQIADRMNSSKKDHRQRRKRLSRIRLEALRTGTREPKTEEIPTLHPVDKERIIKWAGENPSRLTEEQIVFQKEEDKRIREEGRRTKNGLLITTGLTLTSVVASYVIGDRVEVAAEHLPVLQTFDPLLMEGFGVVSYVGMFGAIGLPFRKANNELYDRKGFNANILSALASKGSEYFGIKEKTKENLVNCAFFVNELVQEPLFLHRAFELFQQNPNWAAVFFASANVATIGATLLKTKILQRLAEAR